MNEARKSVLKHGLKHVLGMSIGLTLVAGMTACHKGVSAAQQETVAQLGPDPTDQNMAPVDSAGMPVNASQQQAAPYSAGGAPIERRAPAPDASQQGVDQQQGLPIDPQSYDMLYNDQDNSGQPPIEADQPPPELPVYEQPEAPAANYMWTPGYWGYASMGYYWVPGVWVMAPYPGALWTPCYWGFYGGHYRFYRGYWGLHIGFYGGINYGFGYYGEGYRGGYWNGNSFYYNRAVNRVSPRITNVYVRNVTVVNTGNRVSFNGGRGGLQVTPRPAEVAALRGPRIPPMTTQVQFQRQASENKGQLYNENRGRPAMGSTTLPVAADKGIQRPNPVQIQNGSAVRPTVQNGGTNRPVQPGNVARPGFQGNENRPIQAGRPEVPAVNRPQVQPARPAPTQSYRPDAQPAVRPAPEARPVPQSQGRPVTPQQPYVRPNPQSSQPQSRPVPQQPYVRPNPQPSQPQSRPAPQYRPEQQPRSYVEQPRPEQSRPAPQVRAPQPAPPQTPRPAPQVHTAPPPQQPRPAPAHVEPQDRPHR